MQKLEYLDQIGNFQSYFSLILTSQEGAGMKLLGNLSILL